MKVKISLFTAFAVLATFLPAAPPPAAADFSGTWLGKTEIPNVGVDELILVLKKDKDTYAGTVADSLEVVSPETEIQDVKVEGNVMTFLFPLADGNVVSCKLTLTGEALTGDWTHPEGSTGTLAFEKKR